jgi:hypothetical protein
MNKKLTMQDVLLACGELNKYERVAVEWVLEKAQRGLTVEEAMEAVQEWDAMHATVYQSWDALRAILTAKLNNR